MVLEATLAVPWAASTLTKQARVFSKVTTELNFE